MKMDTPKMTLKREVALDICTKHFEDAAEKLFYTHDIDDFSADDICKAVIDQVTTTDIDTEDWTENLTDENKRAIVTTMQKYFEEFILEAVRDNFDYIMNENGWKEERK